MRRAEQLVAHVRRATENERSGTADGISDEEFLEYLNQGQELVQQAIVREHRTAFAKETTLNASGVESLTLPADCFGRHRILSLEFSPSGVADDYYRLEERRLPERYTLIGHPKAYTPVKTSVLVAPYPLTGTYRLVYDPVLPRIDKRRTTVASRTITSGALTALTLATAAPFNVNDYTLDDFLCVIALDGTIKTAAIPFTAVSAGGVVTIEGGSYTLAAGETFAVGDNVVIGRYSSSHSQLPDLCEKFLLSYCERRILQRDESGARGEMNEDEKAQMAEIVLTFAEISGDIEDIPVISNGYWMDDFY